MSRARSIMIDGREHWFDTSLDGQRAHTEHVELLIDATGADLDELLDADLTQGQVILGLRQALHGNVIPPEVLERKRIRKEAAQKRPECRICGVIGKSTKHHFIPRWIMRELENYQTYAPRSICTIPVCMDCHIDLHDRSTDRPGKSILAYLESHEAELAQRILDDLKEQRPGIFDLIASGDDYTYEYVMVKDYMAGEFARLARSEGIAVQEQVRAIGL